MPPLSRREAFSLPLRGKVPRNEADEVSDTVAFCEVGIIVSVGIHLIHRARSPFPLRGRQGNEIRLRRVEWWCEAALFFASLREVAKRRESIRKQLNVVFPRA